MGAVCARLVVQMLLLISFTFMYVGGVGLNLVFIYL